MIVLRLLPPLAWTIVIAWFSGESWSSSGTGFLVPLARSFWPWAAPEQLEALHWFIRKGAHVTEYAVLAGLWRWALATRGAASWPAALGLSVLTASLDEVHQATTLSRAGSPMDVLLDSAAAGAALAVLAAGWTALDRLIGGLLWIAAVGGGALLAVNWVVAAPSSWLWLSVPAAWIALWFWRRKPGRPPRSAAEESAG